MAKRRRSSARTPTTSTGSGGRRSHTRHDPSDETPPLKRRKIIKQSPNHHNSTTKQNKISHRIEKQFTEDDASSQDCLSSLSLEMICQILEYLPIWDVLKMECQCLHLQEAVKLHLQLLTDIDFTEGEIHGWMPAGFTDNTLKCFLKRCPELMYIYGLHLTHICRRRRRGHDTLSIPGIVAALQQCDSLSGIETSNIFIMEGVLNYLPSVEIMGTFKNRDGEFPIPPQNSITLPRNPQLTSLHLIGVELKELPRMDYLQRLHLKWVRFTDPHPFRECGMPSLRCFVMNNCAGPQNALKYVPLLTGLASARSLSRLELIRVPFLGGLLHHVVEDSWRVSGFRNLHKIKIGACKHVQEADLGYLLITCKNKIEDLCIQPSLTKDSFFYSMTYADADFTKLHALHLGFVDDFPELGKWSSEELGAHGLAEYTDNPAFVTDFGMRCVVRVFSHLSQLKLYNCPQLHSPTAWTTNGNNVGGFSHLTDLHLRRCHAIKLSDFSLFLSSLPSLEHLCLEDMFKEPPKGCSRVGLSAGLGVSSALMGGPPAANPNLAPNPPANQNIAPVPPVNQNPAPNPPVNQNLVNPQLANQNPQLANQNPINNDAVDEEPDGCGGDGPGDSDDDSDDDEEEEEDGDEEEEEEEEEEIDVSVGIDSDLVNIAGSRKTFKQESSTHSQNHNCGKSNVQSFGRNNLAAIGTFSDPRSSHNHSGVNREVNIVEGLDQSGLDRDPSEGCELLEVDGYVWNNVVNPDLEQIGGEELIQDELESKSGTAQCNNVDETSGDVRCDNSQSVHQTGLSENNLVPGGSNNNVCNSSVKYDPSLCSESTDHVKCVAPTDTCHESGSSSTSCNKTDLSDSDEPSSNDGPNSLESDNSDSNCDPLQSKEQIQHTQDNVCQSKGKSLYGAKKGLKRVTPSGVGKDKSRVLETAEKPGMSREAQAATNSSSDSKSFDTKQEMLVDQKIVSVDQNSLKSETEDNCGAGEQSGDNEGKGQNHGHHDNIHMAGVKGGMRKIKGPAGKVKSYTGEASNHLNDVKDQHEEVKDMVEKVNGRSAEVKGQPRGVIVQDKNKGENGLAKKDKVGEVKGKAGEVKGHVGEGPKPKKRLKRTGQRSGKKSTASATRGPVMEDDHLQKLVIKSNSLLSLNLHHVGITDLVLTECKRIATVTASACRVLKNVQVDSVPWLGRTSFTQCPKLRYQDFVDEMCQQPPTKHRLIFLRPVKNYDAVELERHLLKTATNRYHVCLIHDLSPDPEETLYNRVRVMSWPEVITNINYELIKTHKHAEAIKASDILLNQYPWRPGVYNMKGFNENGSEWDLVTDIPWIKTLASAPDKSQNWLCSDCKAGLYSPSGKGHCSMQVAKDELKHDIAKIMDQKRPLFLHSVIVFVNMCDLNRVVPDVYS